MAASVSFIKNPLTIIGVFASLVETAGLAVLPLIDREIQAIYIWFLMLFPTFLVGTFFIVLYKKHVVLYAPSDFKDDGTFADIGSRMFAATAIQIRQKQVAEARELQEGKSEQTNALPNATETPVQSVSEEPEGVQSGVPESRSDSLPNGNVSPPRDDNDTNDQAVPPNLLPVLAEKWSLDLLAEKYRIPFVREIAFHLDSGQLTFDAGLVTADATTVVEVKTTRNELDVNSYLTAFSRAEKLFSTLDALQQRNFTFLLAVVVIPRAKIQVKNRIIMDIQNWRKRLHFRVQLELIDWEELEERNAHLLRLSS